MQTVKKKPSRPWLTSTGVELPTDELRELSRSWDAPAWESYLNWYESGRRESLLPPEFYDFKCNAMTETVFEQFNQEVSHKNRVLCERLLSSLPGDEAKALRLKYFAGRTLREIAALQGLPKSSVYDIQKKAITRLQRGHQGEIPDTCRLLKSESCDVHNSKPTLWNRSSSFPIKEDKKYEPNNQEDEFKNIKQYTLRVALRDPSENQQRIIYLRFWCDYSINEVAHDLRSGVNLVEEASNAAVSMLKRKIVQYETGYAPGGGPTCA